MTTSAIVRRILPALLLVIAELPPSEKKIRWLARWNPLKRDREVA